MTKTNTFGIRLDPKIHAALVRRADEEARPLAAMARLILAEGLRRSGHLSPPLIVAHPSHLNVLGKNGNGNDGS
jgi:hypothetical protein